MTVIDINLSEISDFPSFHSMFAKTMGFPTFYGNNMNAWEDCMSDISRPNQPGMTKVVAEAGEEIVLVLHDSIYFREKLPDIFSALLDSTARINQGKISIPSANLIHLVAV